VPLPSAYKRHLLSRFSYGVTPALLRGAAGTDGANHWFEQQLQPEAIADAEADKLADWYPNVWRDPGYAAAEDKAGRVKGHDVAADFARWTLMRKMVSNRQVHEVMTDFWSNLLHIPSPEKKSWPWRYRYDKVVRSHALGRFEDMLVACVLHPAMGCYLDNARSTAANTNENLGRELLELHTVGLTQNYSETEVRDSAYILTGWYVDVFRTYEASYEPSFHKRGAVRVLGFTDANDNADGAEMSRRYIRYLANHPATARRVAQRLAVRFVSDTPSAGLVTDLAKVFTDSRTDIKTTLRALIAHPEFQASIGAKVRTPVEDAVATWRVLGVQAHESTADDSFAMAAIFQATAVGQRPFDWGRPDGFPDDAEAWTGVSRVLNSFDVHKNVAGGYFPRSGVTYRRDTSWLPPLPATLGQVVNSVAKKLLARPASPALKDAVAARLDLPLSYTVRTPDDFQRWRIVPMLATVLDSPDHMTR
jgi:uncharacterized protein (DUF1800 family)